MAKRGGRAILPWVAAAGGAAALVAVAAALDGSVSRLAAALHASIWHDVGVTISAVAQVEVPLAVLAALGLAAAVRSRPAAANRTRPAPIRLLVRGALVLILSALLAQGLKAVTRRPRPKIDETPSGAVVHVRAGSTNSMPSGHTVAAFALAAALAGGIGRWRFALYGWAGLVGLSRLVVGAHWASDVAVGALLGLALGGLVRRAPPWPWGRAGRWALPRWRPSERLARLVPAAVLVAVALPMFLVGSKKTPLIDRDEPRFAQCAREMIERGDFVVPHLNGKIRFEKPPLSYWAMCGAYAVFGSKVAAARLPSALFGVAACLLTYVLGRRLFGRRVGFAGAAILLCSLQLVAEARAATADAALLALILGAFYAAVRLRDGGRPLVWVPVLYGCLGLSNLAKGPVGIGVVAAAVATFLVVTRDRQGLRRLHPLVGLVIVAAVNAPWLLLVQARTDGEFLRRMVTDHFFAHAIGGKEGHGKIFLMYVPFLAAFFFPWSILLPRALGRAWRERRADPAALFLLCWAVPGFVLFCAVGTKLPHYLLPIYPALSLLVAKSVMTDVDADRDPLFGRVGRLGAVCMVLGAVGAAVGLPVVISRTGFLPVPALNAGFAGLLLTVGVIAAIRLMRRRLVLAGLGALMAAACLSSFGLYHLVLPKMINYNLSEIAAPALAVRRQEGAAIACLGYKEPSLIWLMNGLPDLDTADDLVGFADRHARAACLIRTKEYRAFRQDPRLTFTSLSHHRGFNFAKWKWEEAWVVTVSRRAGVIRQ